MHELSLINSLLDIVDQYARREGFLRVHSLKLSFGKLSCIDPQALRFAFSVQARGTRAEGAELVFDIRPARLYCLTCEQTFSSGDLHPACIRCGSGDVLLAGGTEGMKLLEMDVD